MQWELFLRFLLAALATWRVSFLLAREDGPWSILARARSALGSGMLGTLCRCVKCVSVWIAVPFAAFVGGTWTELVVAWLALSGVASLIDEVTRPPFEFRETQNDELLRKNVGSRD